MAQDTSGRRTQGPIDHARLASFAAGVGVDSYAELLPQRLGQRQDQAQRLGIIGGYRIVRVLKTTLSSHIAIPSSSRLARVVRSSPAVGAS
ncbi:MAG: hypothetical protein BGO49_26160 [Planctomycetales bacterium 71-10]|nr:MAG: hypothetical protein BGO49_26160 [Planctomycetales bacterium 71-10]